MLFKCKRCGVEGEDSLFSQHSGCKIGFDTSRCKKCKKSLVDWESVPLERRMYNRTKHRAKRQGREFSLKLSDIVLPNRCPVFDKTFIYGDPDWTYSIDRIDNSRGYVKDNIVIVSNKANRLKNDASINDLRKVVEFYSSCEIT